ncbi:hypothetical protein [Pseudooceanicola sp. 200-1SW]|uniref:hypothetical protein n=1 Tax=Pseudooceanicola sp. 200-1SW TaxID=3425949 RepID=UPI003D7F995E
MSYQLKDRSFQTGDEWIGALAGRLRVAAAAGEDGTVCLSTTMSPTQARQAASRLDRLTYAEAEVIRLRSMAETPVPRSERGFGELLTRLFGWLA